LRIGLISKRFPPERCGVGDFTCRLAQALQARGDEVVVLTARRNAAQGVPSLAAPDSPHSSIRVREVELSRWNGVAEVLRAIREERCERVQIEYSGYAWGRWGGAWRVNALAWRLRLAGTPLTTAFHEIYVQWGRSPKAWLISSAQRVHIALLALAADEVIVNTAERASTLRRWLPWKAGRVVYRPNASNIPLTTIPSARRAAIRAQAGAGAADMVVATFGNFAAAKKYEAVAEAIARLAERLPVKLWLLGDWRQADPRYVATLRAQIVALGMEGSTFWSGPQSSEEISAFLQAADIFALPQPDGHLTRSGAFMAAAAHGLPVVAVRNDANQREFDHGENVWLTGQSSASEFGAAIAHLAANPDLRERLGGNLRRLYERRFDWPVMVSPHEERETAPSLARVAGGRV